MLVGILNCESKSFKRCAIRKYRFNWDLKHNAHNIQFLLETHRILNFK